MKGAIYSDEKCSVCGGALRDNGKDAVACPVHPQTKSDKLFVRFGREIKKRFTPNTCGSSQPYALAHQFLHGLRSEVTRGKFDRREYIPNSPLAFSTIVSPYLEDRERDVARGELKKKTLISHIKNSLVNYAGAHFKKKSVKAITPLDWRRFFSGLPETLSDKSKWNIRTDIHTFFNWLVAMKEIRQDETPDLPQVSYECALRKTIDRETQIAILEEVGRIHKSNPRLAIGIRWLLTYVNLRPGDLHGILEGDIERTSGLVTIRHHKTVKKTKEPKTIILREFDLVELVKLPRAMPTMPFFRYDTQHWMMKSGEQFGPQAFYLAWMAACNNLGIKGVDLYGGTRHSTMQYMRQLGNSPEQVKRYSEHRTNSFDRYLYIGVAEKQEGADLVWKETRK